MKKPKTKITVKGLSEDRKKMTGILMALSAGFYELRLKSYKNLRSQLCKKYANYARNMLITVKTKKKLKKDELNGVGCGESNGSRQKGPTTKG